MLQENLSPRATKIRQETMEELLRKKQAMQEQKEALLTQIERLNHDMIVVQSKYGALYNASAFILKIPNEVLCHIFLYAFDEFRPEPQINPDSGEEEEGTPPHMEVVYSHVCRHWRAVAFGYTTLWSSFEYDGFVATRVPTDRFDAYMQRSGSHLLSIHLNLSSQFADDEGRLLDLAANHVDRWRYVTIRSDDNDRAFLGIQEKLKDAAAPRLEYFSFRPNVTVPDEERDDQEDREMLVEDISPRIFKSGAPKLSHVYLDATAPHKFLPPLANVTALRLEVESHDGDSMFHWNAFLDVLALPSLNSLSIAGLIFCNPEIPYTQPIVMKSLEHLRIAGETDGLDQVLSYLKAPALETLILANLNFPPKPDAPASVSLPSLHSLYLIDCTEVALSYLSFLAKGSQNLKHLTINSYNNPDDCPLDYLNGEFKAGRKLWMNLQSLTCNKDAFDDIVPFSTFIRPRKRKNPPFSLRIAKRMDQGWKQFADGYARLTKLCTIEYWASGMDILPREWPPNSTIRVPLDEPSDHFVVDVDSEVDYSVSEDSDGDEGSGNESD